MDDETSAMQELTQIVDYSIYSMEVKGCFESAEQALDYIAANHVDVVISDIKLSGISGTDLLKHIREKYPYIAVVLVSAYRDFEYAKIAISYNAFEYITKPIRYTEYLDTLTRLKEVLTNQNESQFIDDEHSKPLDDILSDYFNNVISKNAFKNRMKLNNIDCNTLELPCAMLELQICDIDDYLDNVWLHGRDRLFTAVRQIIPTKIFGCRIFIVSNSDSGIQTVVTSDSEQNLSKGIADISSYLKHELLSLLSLNISAAETARSMSVFELKSILPKSVSYTTRAVMSHLINNELDEIDKIRDTFFESTDIEQQQLFCIQMTDMIKDKCDFGEFHEINSVSIKSILNTSTLRLYFNELINYSQMTDTGKNLEKSIILEAIRYIDENFSRDITLSSVSKHVMLNCSYFSNFFKKQTGECFSEFLLKIRMEHAKKLLKNKPTMKIQAICEYVGYNSQPYFYKMFKAYTGYSPAEYRQVSEPSVTKE